MSSLAFDSHEAAAALKQAGFDEGQAEAVINTVGDAPGGKVATKADLTEAVAAVRADMAAQFAGLHKQLWLMAVGIVGLTVTLVKLIP